MLYFYFIFYCLKFLYKLFVVFGIVEVIGGFLFFIFDLEVDLIFGFDVIKLLIKRFDF